MWTIWSPWIGMVFLLNFERDVEAITVARMTNITLVCKDWISYNLMLIK